MGEHIAAAAIARLMARWVFPDPGRAEQDHVLASIHEAELGQPADHSPFHDVKTSCTLHGDRRSSTMKQPYDGTR